MKKLSTHITVLLTLILGASGFCSPYVSALDIGTSAELDKPVLITEVQTGAATASDEFVELYNRSNQVVDITGWQIRYANPGADPSLLVTITGADNGAVLLPSHAYFVAHTASAVFAAGQLYTASLAKTDKTVGLYAPDRTTCQLTIQDAVAWQSGAVATAGEGSPVPVLSDKTNKEKLLQRYRDETGAYVDSDNNATDWVLLTAAANAATPGFSLGATPGADTTQPYIQPVIPSIGGTSPLPPFVINGCVPPVPSDQSDGTGTSSGSTGGGAAETGSDAGADGGGGSDTSGTAGTEGGGDGATTVQASANDGLAPPQLTELLPNPAAPQADDHDEFIELYNPNDRAYDLTGYSLEVGLTTKHHYVFPAGTQLPATSYVAFFSIATGLSLSNSGGQARIVSPAGAILSQTDAYDTAKDGQVWILSGTSWQWSTSPTPNAANIVAAPISKTATASTAKQSTTAVKSAKTTTASTSKVKTTKPTTKTTTSKTTKAETVQTVAAVTPDKGSLHTGVLAAFALFAILYGAYEYRRDVAHKIHQFRANRAARRADRQAAAGRGGHRTG